MIEICVSYCAFELYWIWFLWKVFETCTMLKKRLYFRRFLSSGRLLRLFANYFTNFWPTASRFFIIEWGFDEHDKDHKFGNSKTHKNLFFNEVTFYFIWLLHCIKSACICLYSVWMRENADTFYTVLRNKRW